MATIGFLGGTGNESKGLALRFAAAGAAVILGSRSAERADQAASACNAILGRTGVHGMSNAEMLRGADLAFLTVPSDRAVESVETNRRDLRPGHILIDVTVPMTFRSRHAEYAGSEGVSNSEVIASHLPPGVDLVAAFKTIPAVILADLAQTLDCDVLVCGDNPAARAAVISVAALIPTLRPLDAGPLSGARTLERMTVLAAELNRLHHKKGARFRIQGL